VYETTVFTFQDLDLADQVFAGSAQGYSYSRLGNPNTDHLARAVAALEGAEAGFCAASGMAAVHAALQACLTPQETRVVAADELYGGTFTLFEEILRPWGVEVQYVQPADIEAVRRAVDGAAVLYLESVSNPTLRVADLEALGRIARDAGARLIVDNTFPSPYGLRPLDYGASLVVHSATKFLDGHHQATAGVGAGDRELVDRAWHYVKVTGSTLDPFCAWLVLRGIRTLGIRLDRQMTSAAALARWLDCRPGVKKVWYPGLNSHPDYEVAVRLLKRGAGAVLSFDLGSLDAARRFVSGLSLVRFATSLGGFDTTVSHPVFTSHRGVPAERRERMGVGEGLIRVSVGCEELQDLVSDFDRALAGALAGRDA
jgi:cystathionine beta-lyase/cystathionine gamma-synthase